MRIALCGDPKWQYAPAKPNRHPACEQCRCDDCPEGPCYDCSRDCPPTCTICEKGIDLGRHETYQCDWSDEGGLGRFYFHNTCLEGGVNEY